MTEEKTLGEIGHEAYLLRYDAIPGVPFNPSKEKLASCWEAAASAVREKVIEECIVAVTHEAKFFHTGGYNAALRIISILGRKLTRPDKGHLVQDEEKS